MRTKQRSASVDKTIGAQIKERRLRLGMTQSDLAKELGITYQQVHKYETGRNRVSAAGLADIAEVLRTPLGYFYDEPPVVEGSRLDLELGRLFAGLTDAGKRAVMSTAKALAAAEERG